PEVKLVLLVENEDTPEQNLEKLGFTPEVYSPYFELIDDHLIGLCKEKNMQLIPWTVNEKEDIRKVLDMGVDGIISDYPDRVVEMVSKNNQE
ncbi:MAG: glycerophosphodiester phosphodiesterase, partial [Bacteroidetes bacterium]|nr:glycerophosphodiester phosphodiesterase [Bacteroidota bacterium]